MLYTCLIFCLFSSFVFSEGNFLIKEKNGNKNIIGLDVGSLSIEEDVGFNFIQSESKGKTQEIGQPELPTFTFSYAIESNKNYEVSLNLNEYIIYENINLYPSQPIYNIGEDKIFVKDHDLYDMDFIYPASKIESKRMSLRGYELLSIEVVPFEYNPNTKQLKVFENPDIIIEEVGTRENNSIAPRSNIFENMYRTQVINSDDYQDSRAFQKPSILYVCGGNLSTSPSLEPLLEWRHKQGFVVNAVSTSEIGSSTTDIKNYILNAYNNWENPPEHVCFIGDANGSIMVSTYTVYGGSGWSSASGEGDFPYSLLEGDDLLPEVTLGRMSIRSTTELITAINKIIGYEKNYAGDLDWLNAIALVGDPYDSGISTVITNQYIEQINEIHGGMTDVRTKYSGSSSFDDWMRDQINDGISYLNYRGFYGFSGFSSNEVNQLNNGYKLPFIATLTCGTGSFATETTCMTESLYRAGTSVNPKGAIAVIGTAQSYTHTAFNNIVDMGIFEGILINGATTAGEAVVYGKLAINEIYPQNPNDNVYLFSTWNNLLGDPSLQLWTSSPETMNVQHDEMLINGSNNFQVLVTDIQGFPLESIRVTLSRLDQYSDEIFMSNETDINGVADFMLPGTMSPGEVFVTLVKQNFIPYESSFFISDDLPEVVLDDNAIIIDEVSGNNDGFWNPGEIISLDLTIINNSAGDINNLSVNITSNSEHVSLSNNLNLDLGNLNSGSSLNFSGVLATASNVMSDYDDPMLRLQLYSNTDDLLWNYIIPVDFKSASISLSYNLDNDNNQLDVGESANLSLSLFNEGSMSLSNVEAELIYNGNLFTFDENIFLFDSINFGEQVESNNAISISTSNSVINGTIVSFPVIISTSSGYNTESYITLQIGNVTVNDPVGPDSHGYYIYDVGDTEYELAPDYDWIEIDPDYGGDGYELDISDSGNNQDDVTSISLPFNFTFYGLTYNSLSVCSNGWISFGQTDMTSFRNYTLPGPGGPSPMVAVFWDDLKTTSGGEIYAYHDQTNNSFIIEWSNLRTYLSNSTESFQVILYDTDSETPTGDDEIKLQYKEFNNTSVGDYPVGNYEGAVVHGQYCTVGIENHLANQGIQYTFNNTYSSGARTLTDQSALFITTRGSTPFSQPSTSYNQSEFIFNVLLDEQESEQLIVTNNGEPGSILIYELDVAPFPVVPDQIDNFGYAWAESQINNEIINYDWIDIEEENTILAFENNDTATEVDMGFDFPFYNQIYSQCMINPNGWIGFEDDNNGWNNQSVFDDDSPNAAIFGFWDDLNPEYSGNEVGSGLVKYHTNEDRLVIWFDNVIHWTDTNRIYDFQIVLNSTGVININYRTMQGEVESATIGIKSPEGEYGLEVVYNDIFVQNNLSLIFNSSNWLSLDLLFGDSTQLSAGTSANYTLNVNTNGLESGEYNAYIINSTNASTDMDVLPVTLNAQNSFILGDLNQDGVVDVLDAVRIISIIMGDYDPSSLDLLLGDLNVDNVINVQDVVLIVSIILSN